MRAGLGVDGQAPVARLGHRVERLAGGEVHQVDRRLGKLGDADDAVGRLALHDGRARQHVPLGAGVAGVERLLHQHVDDMAVLGMDLHHAAVVADQPHGLEDLAVVDHQHVRVGGEELEGADALVVDQALHVAEVLVVHLGHDHVRAHVDGGDRSALVPVGEAFERARPLHLGGEVHDGGGAAEGRGLGTGVEGIGRARGPEIPVEVGVHVDAAGHDQQPLGVMRGDILAHGQVGADHAHAPVLHQDVGPVVVHRRHDPPVPNHGRAHLRLLRAWPAPRSLSAPSCRAERLFHIPQAQRAPCARGLFHFPQAPGARTPTSPRPSPPRREERENRRPHDA